MPLHLYPNVHIDLAGLLSHAADKKEQIASFALLSLGMVESLAAGAMTASRAVPVLFHADNCLFVRKHLKQQTADKIMSHGVQLPDVFDALPAEEAQAEFQRGLATMHALCLKLLGREQAAA